MGSRKSFEGLEAWDVDLREVSASWFVLSAVRKTGNKFEKSGTEPEMLINELREFEATVQAAIQSKLGASS